MAYFDIWVVGAVESGFKAIIAHEELGSGEKC
jgi:hypothetical protein